MEECFCGLPLAWHDGWVHAASGDVRCFPDEPVDDRAAPVPWRDGTYSEEHT